VKRFRGGLVFKAHRLLNHSTLGLSNKEEEEGDLSGAPGGVNREDDRYFVRPHATTGRELTAPRTDRTTRIPSPVTTNHAAKGSTYEIPAT